MPLRRLRLAPLVLAVVAVLALGWVTGAAPGWSAHGASHDAELTTSLHVETPAVAAGAEERVDARAERLARSRWAPLAVVAAAMVGVGALRRRLRGNDAVLLAPAAHGSAARGRAPPSFLAPAH